MKNKKITTILVIIATLALAGIAIYTAIRLYQLRTKSVSPNVPDSKPAAAGAMCGGIRGLVCPSGEVCIYADGSTRAPSPDASGTCQVYSGKTTGRISCQLSFNLATPTPTPTPTRSPSPTPSPTPNPLCNSACTTNAQCPSGLGCYIPAGLTAGNCRNMTCTTKTNCVCPTSTPTSTPTMSPSPTPTASPTASPTPSPTPTPVAQCNTSCTSSSTCPSGLSCYIASGTSGYCRNASCTGETDCVCAVVTPSPSPTPTTYIAQGPTPTPPPQPTLPESGTDWPTILGMGLGILVILGSVLLAF